jgi:aminoglycoside phosphotransferase
MDFPAAWRSQFAGAAIEQQTIGESRADVWRITPAGAAPQFVKTEQVMTWGELPGEVQRLRWMATQDLPAPRVLDTTTEAQHNWLLMTAVAGSRSGQQRAPLAAADRHARRRGIARTARSRDRKLARSITAWKQKSDWLASTCSPG